MLPQDLHIHTSWSTGDSSVVPEQTVSLIAAVRHARILGISDHFDYLLDEKFETYRDDVRYHGLRLGTEVNGSDLAAEAASYPFDYYIYHCRDSRSEYLGIEKLLASNKPVIIAHPFTMGTNIERVPMECYIEINNRYIWRHPWQKLLKPLVGTYKFIISSDAHQPNWLNQNVARYVAAEMDIEETMIFEKEPVPLYTG